MYVHDAIRAHTLAIAIAICAIVPALAQQAHRPTEHPASDMITEDAFGFTAPTDVGDPGEWGYGTENDGRMKKRDGRYFGLATKFFAAYTFAPNWSIGVAGFGSRNYIRDVTEIGRAHV